MGLHFLIPLILEEPIVANCRALAPSLGLKVFSSYAARFISSNDYKAFSDTLHCIQFHSLQNP